MSNITRLSGLHNTRRSMTPLALLACCSLLGACVQGRDADAVDTDTVYYPSPEACVAFISDQGLRDFLSLAERKDEGIEVTRDDAIRLAESAIYTTWRNTMHPPMQADALGRQFFIALFGLEALSERERSSYTETFVSLNYQVTLDYRHLITSFVEEFVQEERVCEVLAKLQDYLPAEALPDTLHLEFFVGLPAIHAAQKVFLIDASMAWALGKNQLVKALASLLYKTLTTVECTSPQFAQGSDILLQTLRMVYNDAVPAYIDGIDEKAYDIRHRGLAGKTPTKRETVTNGYGALQKLDDHLTRMRAKSDIAEIEWRSIAGLFTHQNNTQNVGWFMARTIVDQLGLAHLREASRSVPDFFAKYQQASALPPRQTNAPRFSEEWLMAHPPALSEENATWLESELRRLFP